MTGWEIGHGTFNDPYRSIQSKDTGFIQQTSDSPDDDTHAERLTKDFRMYTYSGSRRIDVLPATVNYRLTCGPEQPVRYLVITFNRRTLTNSEYCDWMNTIREGRTMIYLEAMGGGTFLVTNTTTQDNEFIVYAYGIELLLNSARTYSTAQMSSEIVESQDSQIYWTSKAIYNGLSAEEKEYTEGLYTNGYKSYAVPTKDMTFTYPYYPSKVADCLQRSILHTVNSDGTYTDWARTIVNVDTDKDTDLRHHLSFYADELLMSSLYLCATADNAFVYFSDNPTYDGSTDTRRDACYITDFSVIAPLGNEPSWNTQTGVMNVYPKLDNPKKEYTDLDDYMYNHVIAQSSQSVEGSNTVINSQGIYCVGSSKSTLSKDRDVSKYLGDSIAVKISDAMPSSVFDEVFNADTKLISIIYNTAQETGSDGDDVMYWKHEYLNFNWREDSISKAIWTFEPKDDFAFNKLQIHSGGEVYMPEAGQFIRLTADITLAIDLKAGGTDTVSERQTIGTDRGKDFTLTLGRTYSGSEIARCTVTIDNMSVDKSVIGFPWHGADRLYTRCKHSIPDYIKSTTVQVDSTLHGNYTFDCKFSIVVTAYSTKSERMKTVQDGATYLCMKQLEYADGTPIQVSSGNMDMLLDPIESSVSMGLSVMSVTSENTKSQEMYGDYYGTLIDASLMKVQSYKETEAETQKESQIPKRITDNVVRRYKDPTQATTVLMNECVCETTEDGTVTGWKRAFDDTVRIRKLNDDLNEIYLGNVHACDGTMDESMLRLSVYTRYYPEMYTAYTFGVANASPLGTKIASLQSK